MKKDWLIKRLALGIVVLFVSVSFQPVFAVENKTTVMENQNENKSYVDPNIHLDKSNLPILKKSLSCFKNSNYYDAEIGKVMEQLIKLIEFKGEVNSKDVENILINNKIAPMDIYYKTNIEGSASPGYAFTIPFLLPEILFFLVRWWIPIFFGIGGFLVWSAFSGNPITEIEITVDSTNYTSPHNGYAFGFFGVGHVWQGNGIPEEAPFWLEINGRASIIFVKT